MLEAMNSYKIIYISIGVFAAGIRTGHLEPSEVPLR